MHIQMRMVMNESVGFTVAFELHSNCERIWENGPLGSKHKFLVIFKLLPLKAPRASDFIVRLSNPSTKRSQKLESVAMFLPELVELQREV